jgi:hypothetical protein
VAGFEIADVVADQIDTIGDLMRIIESLDNRGTAQGKTIHVARAEAE